MNKYSTTGVSTNERAERSLRALPGILEARVVDLGDGTARRIAYVAGPGAAAPLPASVARQHGLDRIVPVARLGDATALASLPVWDEESLERLADGFRRRPGVRDVAVAAAGRSCPRFLQRSHLVPATEPGGGEEPSLPAPKMERAEIGARLSDRDALADGGPLRLPAGHPATLGEAFERAAATGRGVTYLDEDLGARRETYGELRERALSLLGGLKAAGVGSGDLLLLDTADAACFLGAFWACLLGGCVAVPLALPEAGADPAVFRRLRAVWEALDRPRLVASDASLAALSEASAELEGVAVLETARLQASAPAEPTPSSDPEETAVIILTSGSTGTPKGVCQRHRALLAMSAALAMEGLGLGATDVFFNWMPLDHVGGTVFQMVLPVILACEQLHCPTAPILADPACWPDLVSRHRVSVSWAPNFAFGLIADAVAAAAAGLEDRSRLWDLSCVRALPNGGEAVTESSLEHFLDRLAPYGLPRDTLWPAFGMSETCTGITLAGIGQAIGPFTSLGRPVSGSALRIVDDEGQLLKEGEIGRLQLRGPQLFSGYYGQEDVTAAAMRDGWFETGDLGFLAARQLYMTGRSKDSININGAKYFAHEIEAAAARVPGIEQANLAAVAVRPAGARTEQVALFFRAPLEAGDDDVLRALLSALRARLAGELGLAPDFLLPLAAGDFPRTSIGKIVRPTLKQRFEAGAYDALVERVAGLLGGPKTLPVGLHRRTWLERPLSGMTGDLSSASVVFAGDASCPAALRSVLRAVPADRSGHRDATPWQLAPADSAGHGALLSAATGGKGWVLHLWGIEHSGETAYRSLLSLARAIAALPAEQRPEGVLTATSGALQVVPGDALDPARALLPGLVRSLNLELPGVRWRLADLAPSDVGALSDILAAELEAGHEPVSAWRAGRRYLARFEPVTPAPASEPPVRPGDLWLVTGGLGGLGRAASARLLARKARLLLVGRTERTGLSADREAALRSLEELGCLRYAALDVGDAAALAEAVAGAEAEAGRPLAGILHLAGVGRPVPLLEDEAGDLPEMRRAALDGLASLHKLLATRPQASLTVAGSIVGLVGGHVVGYAAVNAAAAEAAAALVEAGARVSHLAFSSWTGVGMSEGRTSEALLRADGLLPLDEETGLALLEAASRRPGTSWLVGLDQDHPLHAALTLGEPAPLTRPVAWVAGEAAGGAERHPDALGRLNWVLVRPVEEIARRADGTVDFARLAAGDSGRRVAPRDETERRVAEIFAEVLGLEAPAVDDDFFLAGGTSLLATRLAARLSRRFLVELPVGAIFRHPTVEGLTRQLRGLEPKPGLVDAVARQLAVLESLSTEERAAMQARAGE